LKTYYFEGRPKNPLNPRKEHLEERLNLFLNYLKRNTMKQEYTTLIVTISQRFKETNLFSEQAQTRLNLLHSSLYEGFATDEERKAINNALDAISSIKMRTRHFECIKYCESEINRIETEEKSKLHPIFQNIVNNTL
jgi:hypothetical protein